MNIKVIANNQTARGPGKVYQNLVSGLKELGHGVNQPIIGEHDLTVVLQLVPNIQQYDSRSTLYGPNLVVLPTEAKELFSDPAKHFLVPSQWVKDKYSQFDFVHPDNLHVWAVGIDTNKWLPIDSHKKSQDCFIYFKNRSQADLEVVKLMMRKFKLRYSIIEYGKYGELELLEACHNSNFAILLTDTESQGIAYMEILSTDTPCYVFNKNQWKSEDGSVVCQASSVPYFSNKCGEIAMDPISIDQFKTFVSDTKFLGKNLYSPRDYMINNHTLEQSAESLLRIASESLGFKS